MSLGSTDSLSTLEGCSSRDTAIGRHKSVLEQLLLLWHIQNSCPDMDKIPFVITELKPYNIFTLSFSNLLFLLPCLFFLFILFTLIILAFIFLCFISLSLFFVRKGGRGKKSIRGHFYINSILHFKELQFTDGNAVIL